MKKHCIRVNRNCYNDRRQRETMMECISDALHQDIFVESNLASTNMQRVNHLS